MQLEGLTIELRARTPWEATDLGIALVRQHAARIYAAWLLVTLPWFALLNLGGYGLGRPWLAALAFWWSKPVLDRIPLFVISRAVFGAAPSLRETLRAQLNWGWRGVWRWLWWRRLFYPARAMLLPVDLLEGVSGEQRRERVRVLTRANASPNVMLCVIGAHVEAALSISIVLLGLMFVPVEFLSQSAQAAWQTLFVTPPLWAKVLINFTAWIAVTIIEPFFVGGGFGLYLNRRMQLEAWDIELAFRRLAQRLAQPLAAAALLLIAVCVFITPLRAEEVPAKCRFIEQLEQFEQQADPEHHADFASDDKACRKYQIDATLPKLFGDSYRDDGADFEAAVKKAFDGSDLNPTTHEWVWRLRHPLENETKTETPWWARTLGHGFGFVFEYGLWILLALGLVLLAVNRDRWLPWISDRFTPARAPDPIDVHAVAAPPPLPPDVPTAVRALLQQGRVRAALALLYRAAVERLAERLGLPLPPGATESECLRHARRLGADRYATLFARIVRCWQAAAYAQRLPQASEVEAMLAEWTAPAEPAL
jgi:hypothetical protein